MVTETAIETAKANTERFRATCDELISAIEHVRFGYFTHHPDTPGSEVSRANADHILRILPPLYDVLEWLSDEGEQYGAEDTINYASGFMIERQDAVEALQEFIGLTIPTWESDEKENRT